MTYYELWQKNKYGNILPTLEPDESYEEDLRLAEFMQITKAHAYDIVSEENTKLRTQNIELMVHNKELMNESETCMELNVALANGIKERREIISKLIEVGELEDLVFINPDDTKQFQALVKKAKLLSS